MEKKSPTESVDENGRKNGGDNLKSMISKPRDSVIGGIA
jgi:hypothetical protein